MNSIETEILRVIGESVTSPDVFADIAPIRRSVNDAIQDLCSIGRTYVKTYTLPLVANRNIYRLAPTSDYIAYVSGAYDRSNARYLDVVNPISVSRDDAEWLETTGQVTSIFNLGFNLIGIYQIPSASTGMLEIECVCIPIDYSTDNVGLKINKAFEQALVSFSVSEYYASRGDAARANEYLDRYMDYAKITPSHPKQADRSFRFTGGPTYAGRALYEN